MHSNTEVSALYQHEPSTHGVAVDGGNHGFWQCAMHEGVFDSLLPPPWRAALDRLLHVLAGTKGPTGAGEHRHLELVAVPKLTPRFGQTGAQLLTESIEPLRSVHPNHHHLTTTLRFDNRHNLTS